MTCGVVHHNLALAGLVLRGARVLATLGPLAEEIAIHSPRMRRMKLE